MARRREIEPAWLVVGTIYADEAALGRAVGKLESRCGAMRTLGEAVPFRWTDYYEREMGPSLTRCFLAAREPVQQGRLAELKLEAMAVEDGLRGPRGGRTVNLDPGLLTPENLVLASTKPAPHRVYLGRGIFAEVTLVYQRGAFRPLPWTYPDYADPSTAAALLKLREEALLVRRTSEEGLCRKA